MSVSSASIRPYQRSDEEPVLALIRAIYPDLPTRPLNHVLDLFKDERLAVDVAEIGDSLVAFVIAVRHIQAADPGAYMLELMVAPSHQRQGLGRMLYDHANSRLEDWKATHVYVQTRDDGSPGRAFADRRGFVPTGHVTRLSRLDVRAADLEKSRTAAQRVRDSGCRITTLATEGDAAMHSAYRATVESIRDQPMSEAVTDMPYEVWRGMMLDAPGTGTDMFWIALDGADVVGVAPLEITGRDTAMNAFTGVVRSHRGRGIARALKLAQVESARERGINFIYTGNDLANGPMLAVNVNLGYQPLAPMMEMVRRM